MFKRKLTKEAYDALQEEHKALYAADGDSYVLQVEEEDPSDDTGGGDTATQLAHAQAKRKLEIEHRKNAERERDRLAKELKDLQNQQTKNTEDEHRKSGNVAALDKSWKDKLEAREKELQAEVDKYKNAVRNILVDSEARAIAGRISTAPDLLAPVIASRLSVEYDDNGVASTRVQDAAGQMSALSLEDLEKEIAGDKRYASVIIAGKGSGGGSRGNQGKGGDPTKKLSEMSEQERVDWSRKDPAGFRAATSASSNF